ncbi:gallinacin-3-like [Haemorhous mexicanus]|uniref:gallinacin-3-like n=1 Tax=Haemorhous mexicanus TaxID=30427 RepID=UPI0028BE5893|nr:gallinacin-3-like [Haemorhous mexicanus]
MRILFLLIPLFLLLVPGAAAGKHAKCIRRGGFCALGGCRFPYKYVGVCSTLSHCCKISVNI